MQSKKCICLNHNADLEVVGKQIVSKYLTRKKIIKQI